MPPRRNNKAQAKIASEVIESKINKFVSKSTEDSSSDDSGDEVNIYVESMRKSKIPLVVESEIEPVLSPAPPIEAVKKIRVRPSRAKPKLSPNPEGKAVVAVENTLSHPPALDYFKLLEQYKGELDQTKKELDEVKSRPTTAPTAPTDLPEKKSDLDIRREMFKLRFQ